MEEGIKHPMVGIVWQKDVTAKSRGPFPDTIPRIYYMPLSSARYMHVTPANTNLEWQHLFGGLHQEMKHQAYLYNKHANKITVLLGVFFLSFFLIESVWKTIWVH